MTNPEDLKTLAALNEFIKECEIIDIYHGATTEGRGYSGVSIQVNILCGTDEYNELCSRMGTDDEDD